MFHISKDRDFKFNFNDSITSETDNIQFQTDNKISDEDWISSTFEVIPKINESLLAEAKKQASSIAFDSLKIKHLKSSVCTRIFQSGNKSISSLSDESDLVPGVYEGGFKLWECSIDLANFVHSTQCLNPNTSILELGCGAGIPGILAYLVGCQVTFQDFNSEVLEMLTIPNVCLNTSKIEAVAEVTFLSGHWVGIKEKYYNKKTDCKRYDTILTSETIYDRRNQRHLLELMKVALKPDGKIYLAAKTHYFGVGGTLDEFLELVESDGAFISQVVHEIEEGVQRKIVMLRFQPKQAQT